ncbi:MAG: redoxin domain-containing protein [Vicinamibacterales bacterium]
MKMIPMSLLRRLLALLVCASVGGAAAAALHAQATAPPALGERARDFTLNRLDGGPVHLATLNKEGRVVVVMLRGWVGYQCPICNRQVGDFLRHAADFKAAGASVVLVYPGAAETLQGKAEDFVTGKTLPDNFHFVVDPNMKVVNLYSLRWDAPQETAYPATFVFDAGGVTRFVKISRSHGDRSSATDVLKVMAGLQR